MDDPEAAHRGARQEGFQRTAEGDAGQTQMMLEFNNDKSGFIQVFIIQSTILSHRIDMNV